MSFNRYEASVKETLVDGPQIGLQSNGTLASSATSLGQPTGYGFMDDHKKNMIEKRVEVQTAQIVCHNRPDVDVGNGVMSGGFAESSKHNTLTCLNNKNKQPTSPLSTIQKQAFG